MPFADKKTWEDTRPSACKGSGVAAACKSWAAACKQPDTIASNSVKVEAARAAILEMQNALSTASKKMTKVKTTDPKHAPTTKLIADWQKAATAYHRQLEQDIETATRNKALEIVDKVINDAVRNDIEVKFPDFIKAAENALSKRPPQLTVAENAINAVRTGYTRGGGGFLERPALLIKRIEEEAHVPAGTLKLTDIANKLKPLERAAAEILKKTDELMEEIMLTGDPEGKEPTSDDPTFKKNHKEVMQDYKDLIKALEVKLKDAVELNKKASNADGNPLIETNPSGMLRVAEKLLADIAACKQESADILYDIRDGSGKVKKKIKALALNSAILDFEPFMSRGVTVNGAVITACNKARISAANVLRAIAEGGSEVARDAATALTKVKA